MHTKKQTWAERIKKRNKLGFSLVELIVVVAIMAIFTAVLAPSLLSYVERSRAQKDNTAMDEVTNAVFLAMADPFVYDELAQASQEQNVSCYIDTNTEDADARVTTKDGADKQYIFGDDSRRADETKFHAAGVMRGTTITFEPNQSSNKSSYDLSTGIVNKFMPDEAKSIMNYPRLYNAIRSTIGDVIELNSQTYRNSEYTIFVKIGSTGGNEAAAQDAMVAYGQFSGTNLPFGDNQYWNAFGRDVDDATVGTNPGDTPTEPNDPNAPKTVKGVWVFNETIESIWNYMYTRKSVQKAEYEITFSSNGKNFIGIEFVRVQIDSFWDEIAYRDSMVFLSDYEDITVTYSDTDPGASTNKMFFAADGFDNSAYRTIDFGPTEQEVTEEFYAWLIANATKKETN